MPGALPVAQDLGVRGSCKSDAEVVGVPDNGAQAAAADCRRARELHVAQRHVRRRADEDRAAGAETAAAAAIAVAALRIDVLDGQIRDRHRGRGGIHAVGGDAGDQEPAIGRSAVERVAVAVDGHRRGDQRQIGGERDGAEPGLQGDRVGAAGGIGLRNGVPQRTRPTVAGVRDRETGRKGRIRQRDGYGQRGRLPSNEGTRCDGARRDTSQPLPNHATDSMHSRRNRNASD
jgi:hypothetical protein